MAVEEGLVKKRNQDTYKSLKAVTESYFTLGTTF
jgi:hypothetical protein